MMRGINHQNIFEDETDYYRFLTTLDAMAQSYEPDGTPSGRNYTLYAYCLMSNHVHLLIREREDNLAMAIKRIASSYVYYYNHKYLRDGHLFKERFRSEPVNDMAYFTILLRYIHQNPVKAGIVERVKDYEYSSWGEYDGTVEPVLRICDTETVLKRIPYSDLEVWVNDPIPDDVGCLEMEESEPFRQFTDDKAWRYIKELTGVDNSTAFQNLEKEMQREALRELREIGASVRQLERLTGIGRGIIQRMKT